MATRPRNPMRVNKARLLPPDEVPHGTLRVVIDIEDVPKRTARLRVVLTGSPRNLLKFGISGEEAT